MEDQNELPKEPLKSTLRTPFSAFSEEELKLIGVIPETASELRKIPDILVESHIVTRKDNENSYDRYYQNPFTYRRFVDKEGKLHYWSIDISPQFVGDSIKDLDLIVNQDPSYDWRLYVKNTVIMNLPSTKISPDLGAVMKFPEGITLNVGLDGNFIHKDGQDYPIPNDQDVSEEKHYKTETITVNVEDYLFPPKRKNDNSVYFQGELKHLSIKNKELFDRFDKLLQSGLVAESDVRKLINPMVFVYTEPIEGDKDSGEEVAA